MEGLLNLNRQDMTAARWFTDEETGQTVEVDKPVADQMFNRFMNYRSMIQHHQADIKMRCVHIGWLLSEMQKEKLHQYVCPRDKNGTAGYSSFYKFCGEVFGFKERSAKRMVAVARAFCGVTVEGDNINVRLEYSNFSYSQLAELLSVDEKYHERIPPNCSCRQIRHLSELYKEYVPPQSETVEDDLKVWARKHKEKKAKANAKKNAITFVPTKVPTSAPAEGVADATDFDGEDERGVITPTRPKVSFEGVKKGLMTQLDLLKNVDPAWEKFAELVQWALKDNVTNRLVPREQLLNCQLALKDAQAQLKKGWQEKRGVDAAYSRERLNLKNKKEREEWLKNYRSWGIWLDVPEVAKRFYRYDFCNGTSMIVEDYLETDSWNLRKDPHVSTTYGVIDVEHREYAHGVIGGFSGAIDWLTKHGKEI